MKDEHEVVRKLIVPILKDVCFVKAFQRIDRLHQKLNTEGALTSEEASIKHPFHPDVDVLYWSRKYEGEPAIFASEVKYFRLRDDNVYPTIYEGLGEAMMLFTFGFDYVSLWHFFDPEIPSETVTRYRDLTQSLINDTNSAINYRSWMLSDFIIPESTSDKLFKFVKNMNRLQFVRDAVTSVKPNPLINRWDAKIIRAIIKRGYRIISKR
jgi:hypothetical protein